MNTFSHSRYPLALGYLAGIIKKKTNWEVMAYNTDFVSDNEGCSFSYVIGPGFDNYINGLKDLSRPVWREFKSTISDFEPTVIGISAKSQNFTSACVLAKIAKQFSKDILVVVGGPHPSMVGSDVLKSPDIDVAVIGEGENTVVELLEAIETQSDFRNIPGIIYRKHGQTIKNPRRKFIDDLDSLPFPHETAPEVLKDYEKYPITAFKHIFSTRGCPYNCFFCGSRKIWSRNVRFRSPENVVKEITSLQNIGLKSVNFEDDIFGVNKKHLENLCDAIKKKCSGLKFSCEIHAKLVDEDVISIMKKSGCHSIHIGVESGNDKMLRKIRKGITIEEAFSAAKIIKKHGIELNTYFMAGFPEETEETLSDTMKAIQMIKSDQVVYSIFTPYPGTEAFEFCKENGLIHDDFDVSLYNHSSPANCFCKYIHFKRFRVLASQIERMIVKKNKLNLIRKSFSLNTFWRIQELGIVESLKTFRNMIRN
ncbi:MAG: B12-binding domain-containing radical SAM protein [Candidatus Hodarchaeota archaeon]